VLPPLTAGESFTVLKAFANEQYRFMVEVRIGASVLPIVDVGLPLCSLSPTAPTVNVAVERCADGDSGGAITVTLTNPPGGREDDLEYAVGPTPDAGQFIFASQPEVGDGAVTSEVVEDLAAGDYRLFFSWYVDVPTTPSAVTYLGQRDPVEFAVPACPTTSAPPTEAPTTLAPAPSSTVRVATFNVALSRPEAGDLVADLSTPDDPQAAAVAEILQRSRPDVVLLGGFDLDADDEAVELFLANYLAVPQHDGEAIDYPFWFTAEVNAGERSGFDLDRDGTAGGAGDAFGLGEFPGQAGMVVLSRYPILGDGVRAFQHVLWASMPDARLPDDPSTPELADWYSAEELAVLPLASASFWDVPIDVDGDVVHLLASAPAAPGPNGIDDPATLRNADEIRFWADYIAGNDTGWIVDDAGVAGGLDVDAEFVIVGDLNADPVDGDSVDGAIQQLLDLEAVQDPLPTSDGAVEAAELQAAANATHEGDPALDTADFVDDPAPGNLRVDYVLPSDGFDVVDAGVFWPASDDPQSALVGGDPAVSWDHHLVWADLARTAAVTPAETSPTTDVPSSTPIDYGFTNFVDVPQLGNEAVRGTGCGGDGSIGDVIPDGYWRGYVRSWDGANLEQSSSFQFDLICIYLEAVGDQHIIDGSLVNHNDRTRTVPIAAGFFAHGTAFSSEEAYASFDQPDVPVDLNRQVWLRIVDGAAIWVVSSPFPD
jgi:hypothetical protein